MLTEFGKYLRRLRMDRGEYLKDMADCLGMTPAYLSSIENGKRKAPVRMVEIISEKYSLDQLAQDELYDAFALTQEAVNINLRNTTGNQKELGLTFARRFDDLSKDQIQDIIKILNSKGG